MIGIQKEIMNYKQYVCQFKKFVYVKIILVILISCAGGKVVVRPSVEPTREWFKAREMRKFVKGEFLDTAHLFFDFNPQLNLETRTTNFVPLSFIDSDYHYNLDLLSGRKVVSHEYCSELDAWERYNDKLGRPPFTYGFVPRLLNKRKEPQKIVVFGDRKYLSDKSVPSEDLAYKVRVVGGLIEQYCDTYPCDLNNTWENSVILIAVIDEDPNFKNVKTLVNLKRIVNWAEVKSFLENGRGRIKVSINSGYPAYRVYGASLPLKSMKYVLESGHLFSKEEISTLNRACLALYDKLLDIKDRVLKGEGFFNKEFYKFYRDYWKPYNTCSRFVRPIDISKGYESHWFFEYIRAFSIAGEYGYVYSCDSRDWINNTHRLSGKEISKQIVKLKACTSRDINESFMKAVNLLTGFSKSNKEHYRYIQYDQGQGAFNEKIYSWVKFSGKEQLCQKNSPDSDEFFPKDISWKPIYSPKLESVEKIRR